MAFQERRQHDDDVSDCESRPADLDGDPGPSDELEELAIEEEQDRYAEPEEGRVKETCDQTENRAGLVLLQTFCTDLMSALRLCESSIVYCSVG